MEALEEEQEGEEGDEARREVVPEHSERQACLGHCVPGALDEMLMVERKEADYMYGCHLQHSQSMKYWTICYNES